jgi:hypothetical protein
VLLKAGFLRAMKILFFGDQSHCRAYSPGLALGLQLQEQQAGTGFGLFLKNAGYRPIRLISTPYLTLQIMKKNMGTADRTIRLIVAALIAGLYFTNIITGTWAIVLLVLAGVFVFTSLLAFCPLYTLFGISTCPMKKA